MSPAQTIIPGLCLISPEPEPASAWQSPNLYLLGQDPLTLIDSGYDRESNLSAVREAVGGNRLGRIILTHAHVDHAGGAWKLREQFGAEVLLHPDEEPALSRRFPGHHPDRFFEAGEELAAGDFLLEVILVPGHAKGHAAFYLEKEGILFSGDLITGDGSSLVAPPEGNMRWYMNSLYLVQQMPLKLILPGHGPLVTDPARRIAELIEHRELREICIAKCLAEQPLTLRELVRAMYLGLIHPQLEGAAAGTAWAHLEKMLEDGTVLAEPAQEKNPFARTFRLAPGLDLPF